MITRTLNCRSATKVLAFPRRLLASVAGNRVSWFEGLAVKPAVQAAAVNVRWGASPGALEELSVTPDWAPIELVKKLPREEGNPVVAVRVNGVLRGLRDAVGPAPVSLDFVRFNDADGKRVFWHSAAHVLGAALERVLGPDALLCDGPPVLDAEGGFFYEFYLRRAAGGEAATLPATFLADLEKEANSLVSANAPFERVIGVARDAAAGGFSDNPFKLDMLASVPEGEGVSVYRCGPFVDLCRGPHVPSTGVFRAFALYRVGASHWHPPEGSAVAQGLVSGASTHTQGLLLQRVYGIAFPSPRGLREWRDALEAARARDHRVIGARQRLFFFHELSPGSAFLLPHGTRIYNALVTLLRAEYRRRGYSEVASPLVYKSSLWATSGHLDAYAENMFAVAPMQAPPVAAAVTAAAAAGTAAAAAVNAPGPPASITGAGALVALSSASALAAAYDTEEGYGLKPMNCPGHCLIFKHEARTGRSLPIRLADFSALHRNEASGALGGLTRLRRFQQDDAHIFCRPDQVQAEVRGCLDFVAYVYRLLGFAFRVKLSTRPERFVGDVETWDAAEAALRTALERFSADPAASGGGGGAATGSAAPAPVEVDEGGGAFYGPKVDVFVRDAIGREHQCATVQLDFQLPARFELEFAAAGGASEQQQHGHVAPHRPVIIHRAILGSLERMMAILIEHTGGRWPFWLSPRQVLVCSVAERHAAYAQRVAEALSVPLVAAAAAPAPPAAAAPASPPLEEAAAASAGAPSSSPPSFHDDREDSGLWVDVDASDRTVPRKVRDGQAEQYNLILVVGDTEAAAGTATVRFRDEASWAAFSVAAAAVPDAAVAALGGAGSGGQQAGAAGDKSSGSGAAPARSSGGGAAPARTVTLPTPVIRSVCAEMAARRL